MNRKHPFCSYLPILIVLSVSIFSCKHQPADENEYRNWEIYRGGNSANQYAALDQINRENVKNLRVAWTYNTGGSSGNSTIECNPIIVDGVMYVTSPIKRTKNPLTAR